MHPMRSAPALTGMSLSCSLRVNRRVLKYLAIGINHEKDNLSSAHAEEVALDKLCRNKTLRKNRIVDVSLLVIRLTCSSTCESYALTQSRPCILCVMRMADALDYGFRVKKVYYSDSDGQIICTKFKDFIQEQHYVTKARKKKLPKRCANFNLIKRNIGTT
jgi:tRNA(Arg) A34 adenosine deaminase TadA